MQDPQPLLPQPFPAGRCSSSLLLLAETAFSSLGDIWDLLKTNSLWVGFFSFVFLLLFFSLTQFGC